MSGFEKIIIPTLVRYVRRFAFKPVRTATGKRVWLRWVMLEEVCIWPVSVAHMRHWEPTRLLTVAEHAAVKDTGDSGMLD